MKSIIAVNNKFMDYTPYELVELIKTNSKYTDGFEIYINYQNKEELKYLKDLATCCKKNDYHFQVHSTSTLTSEQQINFLKELEELSDYLEYKINVVLHSVKAQTSEESLKLTLKYLEEIMPNVNHEKVTISLENLNDIPGDDRLNLTDVLPIVANTENLFLTYDIGHDIVDCNDVTGINKEMIPFISNVHIHSTNHDTYIGGFDHKPIFKGDEKWNEIIKSILYLKNNNYDKSIVFEYEINICPGDTLEERIISYCKSMDYVAERFK